MAAGYTRQAAANIQAGLPIQSADHNAEYNQLQLAFDNTTGHDHSGSAAGTGAKINLSTSVTNVLPLANGGGGGATAGSVLFSNGTIIAQNNSKLFWDDTNRRLGIGTATPITGYGLNLYNSAGTASGILIQGTGSTNAVNRGLELSIGTSATYVWNYENSTLILGTNNSEKVTILASGNVGIGQTSPAQKLDVTGNVNITGNIVAGGNISTVNLLDVADTHVSGARAISVQGGYLAWNRNPGDGATYIINQKGGGTGGIRFGEVTAGNIFTQTGVLDTSGNLSITGTYQVNGSQIAHPNLSDYTGPTTWTPTDASGAGLSLTVTDARYLRLGKLVIASAAITYPVTGNGTAAKLDGLPVASFSGTAPVGGGAGSSVTGLANQVFIAVLNNSTQFTMQGAAGGNYTNANLSGTTFRFTIMYISA